MKTKKLHGVLLATLMLGFVSTTAFGVPMIRLYLNISGNGSTTLVDNNYPPDNSVWVTITAIPDPGESFTGWIGDVISPDQTITFLMDGEKNITATFTGAGPAEYIPATPTLFTAAQQPGCESIRLSWTDNADNEDEYIIKEVYEDGSSQLVATLPPNSESYIVTGLQANNEYFYRLEAKNSYGSSVKVHYLGSIICGTGGVPAAPTEFNAISIACDVIELTWIDNAYNEEYYDVKQVNTDGSTTLLASLPYNSTNYTVENLTGNTEYSFRLQAKNASGTSNSVDASATTLPCGLVDNLSPVDDSFVKSTRPNKNYGSLSTLKVNSANKEAFVKFYLNNIGTVSSATLNMTSQGVGNVELWKVTNDTWNENSITWNNKPVAKVHLGTYNFTAAGTESVDVTQFVNAHAVKDDMVSFALINTAANNVIMESKEGINGPVLVVAHDGLPKAAVEITKPVEMFPNPTTGLVNIAIKDAAFNIGTVRIYNMFGILIESMTIEQANTSIIFDGIPGIYVIQVSYNDTLESFSIIKN